MYKRLHFIQTEAERRRREAGVKQSMEIRLGSCMYLCMWVGGYVWYLELSREPRHVAQQARYYTKISSAQSQNAREYWQQPTLSSEDGQLAKTE